MQPRYIVFHATNKVAFFTHSKCDPYYPDRIDQVVEPQAIIQALARFGIEAKSVDKYVKVSPRNHARVARGLSPEMYRAIIEVDRASDPAYAAEWPLRIVEMQRIMDPRMPAITDELTLVVKYARSSMTQGPRWVAFVPGWAGTLRHVFNLNQMDSVLLRLDPNSNQGNSWAGLNSLEYPIRGAYDCREEVGEQIAQALVGLLRAPQRRYSVDARDMPRY